MRAAPYYPNNPYMPEEAARALREARRSSKAEGIMDHHPTELERAFQLAKSGSCSSMSDIRDRLRSEGYSTARVTGDSLARQLRNLMQTARMQTDE